MLSYMGTHLTRHRLPHPMLGLGFVEMSLLGLLHPVPSHIDSLTLLRF